MPVNRNSAVRVLIRGLCSNRVQIMDVDVSASGEVLSASVDSTGRIWQGGQSKKVLTGHEGSVLAVLALPNGDVLTASSDKTIKQWQNG
eukprot:2868282-Pyramimonas_sp.AAC.1